MQHEYDFDVEDSFTTTKRLLWLIFPFSYIYLTGVALILTVRILIAVPANLRIELIGGDTRLPGAWAFVLILPVVMIWREVQVINAAGRILCQSLKKLQNQPPKLLLFRCWTTTMFRQLPYHIPLILIAFASTSVAVYILYTIYTVLGHTKCFQLTPPVTVDTFYAQPRLESVLFVLLLITMYMLVDLALMAAIGLLRVFTQDSVAKLIILRWVGVIVLSLSVAIFDYQQQSLRPFYSPMLDQGIFSGTPHILRYPYFKEVTVEWDQRASYVRPPYNADLVQYADFDLGLALKQIVGIPVYLLLTALVLFLTLNRLNRWMSLFFKNRQGSARPATPQTEIPTGT